MNRILKTIALCVLSAPALHAAPPALQYSAEFIGATSTGEFAPYMLAAGRNGLLSRKNTALLDVAASKVLD